MLEWRWLAVLGCAPPSLMLLLMCVMPETPRFLLTQHRRQEAMAALRFLWGSEQGWEDPPIGAEQSFHPALLRQPGIYKPFIIGVSLMAFQQLSGVNAVMFYAETIFEEAKFKVKGAPAWPASSSPPRDGASSPSPGPSHPAQAWRGRDPALG